MNNYRHLAKDIVRLVITELYSHFDTVWEYEDDYKNTVMAVEELIETRLESEKNNNLRPSENEKNNNIRLIE